MVINPHKYKDPNEPEKEFIMLLSDWIDNEVFKECVKEMERENV